MPNYKISVSKENKKYTIIFKAENEAVARDRVHKEWYSILGIEEVSWQENIWNTFIFEAFKNWEIKHWKIAWDDIFKVYVKLLRNLEYDVFALYSEKDKDKPQEYKKKLIDELKEEYDLLFKDKKKDKLDELREKIKKEKWEAVKTDQFHMKKELEEINKLIVHVLIKLEAMILWNSEVKINDEQKVKFENIYNSIIKLKKSTNISKLKQIWELALQKIWELELNQLEQTKEQKNRELLKETNKLLSELWSKDKFIEKDKDVLYQIKNYIDSFKKIFKKSEEESKKESSYEIDKESYSYVKTQLYLNKYKEKLIENNKIILKEFFKILKNSEYRDLIFLKRSVIKQNIFIYNSRLKWKNISYSIVSKWFFWVFWFFSEVIDSLRKVLFSIIFTFLILFLFYFNLNIWDINFDWLFLFLILFLFYIFISISKKIHFLFINFALFCFIVILGVINF